ncbi:MAG: hypothetical protein AAF327_07535 [Cyanobacteria bacterium P01_A01_bin.37]
MQLKLVRKSKRRSRRHQKGRPGCGHRPPRYRSSQPHNPCHSKSQTLRHSAFRKARGMVLEAMFWLFGAVIIRLILNVVMTASSQFWMLGVVVACLPAMTAIWMTHLSPRQGFVLGYRCLLVMTGLLLGGKLGGVS